MFITGVVGGSVYIWGGVYSCKSGSYLGSVDIWGGDSYHLWEHEVAVVGGRATNIDTQQSYNQWVSAIYERSRSCISVVHGRVQVL